MGSRRLSTAWFQQSVRLLLDWHWAPTRVTLLSLLRSPPVLLATGRLESKSSLLVMSFVKCAGSHHTRNVPWSCSHRDLTSVLLSSARRGSELTVGRRSVLNSRVFSRHRNLRSKLA